MVGVSADKAEVQRRFIEKFELTFPLVPDPGKHIIDAYGAREVLGVTAKRKTFLVDPDGRIAHIWPRVNVDGHTDEVVSVIESLRKAEPKP